MHFNFCAGKRFILTIGIGLIRINFAFVVDLMRELNIIHFFD